MQVKAVLVAEGNGDKWRRCTQFQHLQQARVARLAQELGVTDEELQALKAGQTPAQAQAVMGAAEAATAAADDDDEAEGKIQKEAADAVLNQIKYLLARHLRPLMARLHAKGALHAVSVKHATADEVIAALVHLNSISSSPSVMCIKSIDKDFWQLSSYQHVRLVHSNWVPDNYLVQSVMHWPKRETGEPCCVSMVCIVLGLFRSASQWSTAL